MREKRKNAEAAKQKMKSMCKLLYHHKNIQMHTSVLTYLPIRVTSLFSNSCEKKKIWSKCYYMLRKMLLMIICESQDEWNFRECESTSRMMW